MISKSELVFCCGDYVLVNIESISFVRDEKKKQHLDPHVEEVGNFNWRERCCKLAICDDTAGNKPRILLVSGANELMNRSWSIKP
jgi:hypothetical protein